MANSVSASFPGSRVVTAHMTSLVRVENHCKNSFENIIVFCFYLSLTFKGTVLLIAEKGLSFLSQHQQGLLLSLHKSVDAPCYC